MATLKQHLPRQQELELNQKANNKYLKHLDSSTGTADLWRAVNKVLKKPWSQEANPTIIASTLNSHYAGISSDRQNSELLKKHMVINNWPLVSEIRLFSLLDSLHHTMEGMDGLPLWFL